MSLLKRFLYEFAIILGVALSAPPAYNKGDSLATRQAYGNALAKIATASKAVVALDGDMKNSTFSQTILKVNDIFLDYAKY